MSGRTIPTESRLSRVDLAFMRRAAQGLGHGGALIHDDDRRVLARTSPVFVDTFMVGRLPYARLTEEGYRVLAARRRQGAPS